MPELPSATVCNFVLVLQCRAAAAAHGITAFCAHAGERVAGSGGALPADVDDERRPDKKGYCREKGGQ
jgi:hypothetical protein